MLQGILTGQSRLNEVVNSMLDVSRIDNEALDARIDKVDFKNVIGVVSNAYKPALAERELTLTVNGLGDLPSIKGDTDLIQKMFSHLVVNAINYTPAGGQVR